MPMVRFDRTALATGAATMGLFTLVEMRLGIWSEPVAREWTLDRTIVEILLVGALFTGLFMAGHAAARKAGKRGRSVYAAIGALAAAPGNLLAMGGDAMAEAKDSGMLSVLIAAPLVAGAVIGFLYHRRAGYETDGDDPAALAAAAAEPAEAEGGTAGGFVETASASYYDGPLQVKTSGMAALIAAVVGGASHSLMSFSSLLGDPLPADAMPPVLRDNPGLGVVYGIIGFSIPYLVFVKATHGYLQRREKSSIRSYVLAGVFVPLMFAGAFFCLMGPFGVLFAGQFMVPSIIAMAAYYRLAGLEPLSLPDDIEVDDPRTLVAANHPRRRMRRVIVDPAG